MTPILFSQNNLPIYTKESIIKYLSTLYDNEEKITYEYESKWLSNNNIVILLDREVKYDGKPLVEDESDDELKKLETMFDYINNLEKKFLTDEEK